MVLRRHIIHRMCFIILIAIVPQTALSFTKPTRSNLDSLLHEYESFVSEHIELYDAPGVAIAIVADRKIVFMQCYGVRKAGQQDSINAHTVFRIASVSKGFASVLAGLLVKDGILNWDDKIIKYLPDFSLQDSAHTNQLTIRHILSHTSGLVPHAYDNLIEDNVSLEKIVDKLKGLPVHCPVGECYGYQNVVYSLIADVIKSATGKEYTRLLSDRILRPLAMNDVSFNKNQFVASDNYASPHKRKNWEWIPTTIKDTYYSTAPASGINASIYDMAQWLMAMLDNKPEIIPIDVIDEVCKPQIHTPRERRKYNWHNRLKSAFYGMGWRIFDYSGHTLIYHSGGLRGYLATMAFLPDHGVGIVVLQHSWFNNPFVYKFLDMYLNIEQDIPSEDSY